MGDKHTAQWTKTLRTEENKINKTRAKFPDRQADTQTDSTIFLVLHVSFDLVYELDKKIRRFEMKVGGAQQFKV